MTPTQREAVRACVEVVAILAAATTGTNNIVGDPAVRSSLHAVARAALAAARAAGLDGTETTT